jgi:uncharacterized protein (TIGR03435 family)
VETAVIMVLKTLAALSIAGGVLALAGFAQSAPLAGLEFDAVSVKPCTPGEGPARGGGGGGGGVGVTRPPVATPGRVYLQCVSVTQLINQAYVQFADGQVHPPTGPKIEGGPDWIRLNPGPAFTASDRFTIEARAQGTPSQEMMRGPMLQTVLADRFRLKLHRETREVPAYALTVDKAGAKLQPFREGSCFLIDFTKFPREPTPDGMVPCEHGLGRKGPNVAVALQADSLSSLANILGSVLGRPGVDQTGIKGLYDFEFEYGNDENSTVTGDESVFCASHPSVPVCKSTSAGVDEPAGPSIFTVLQKQFGLKLEPSTAAKEFIVIDRVERPFAELMRGY